MQLDKNFDTGFILFSGYNQRAVIALCRTLKNLSVPYYIVASTSDDTIFFSKHRTNVFETRNKKLIDLDDISECVRRIVKRGHCTRYVIAPSSESLNIFFLRHQSIFDELNCVIPLVPLNIYKLISDKLNFYRLCQDYSFSVPPIVTPELKLSFPFVAKPVTDINSNDRRVYTHIISTDADYELFQESENLEDYFFEQYIEGQSYYLLYYFNRNGEIYKFSQKNLVQQAEGKSIVAAEPSSIHLEDRFMIFDKLLLDVSFHGLLMIEIRFKDSIAYMIEANPRMWGPSQLMLDAGMNLFTCMVNDYCQRNYSMQSMQIKRKPVLYSWVGGFYESLIKSGYVSWYCDRNDFVKRFRQFLESDVYLREDTKGIFEKELTGIFSIQDRSWEV